MISLNGIATVVGGKNIIPIETKTEATTRSITKNGKNITKPILKAVFSSDKINDGIKTYVGTSFLFFGFSIFDNLTNSASYDSWVCLNIKSLIGTKELSIACC